MLLAKLIVATHDRWTLWVLTKGIQFNLVPVKSSGSGYSGEEALLI